MIRDIVGEGGVSAKCHVNLFCFDFKAFEMINNISESKIKL